MVERRKEGNRAVYEISDPMVFDLCELVCGGVQRQVDELQRILEGE
jgi:ArsR family transcriptional regulator